MKKIISLIVVAVLGWLVGTWLIGSKIKSELENYIDKTNNIYATSSVEIKLTDFKKSFFTSSATVELASKDKLINEILELPIKTNYDIEHGPIFFKNGLGFGIAKMRNKLSINSILKEKNIFKDDMILSSDCIVDFTKNIASTSTTNMTIVENDELKLTISPIAFSSYSNLNDFTGIFKAKIEKISLQPKDGKKEEILFKNTLFNGDITELTQNKILLGDYKISSNIVNKSDEKPFDIDANIDMNIVKDTKESVKISFDMNTDMKNTLLPKDMLDLKSAKLNYTLEGLSIAGLITFDEDIKELEQLQKKMLSNISGEEIAQYETKLITLLIDMINRVLIKDKSSISYALNATTKDNKNSHTKIKIGYVGEKLSTDFEAMKRKLLDMVTLNLDVDLSKSHIDTLPSAKIIKQQLQMGINQGFLKEDSDKYSINASYKPQTILINDKDMTSTLLPLVKMFLFMPTRM